MREKDLATGLEAARHNYCPSYCFALIYRAIALLFLEKGSVLTVLLRREAEEGEVDRRDVSVERGRDGAVFWGLAPLGVLFHI